MLFRTMQFFCHISNGLFRCNTLCVASLLFTLLQMAAIICIHRHPLCVWINEFGDFIIEHIGRCLSFILNFSLSRIDKIEGKVKMNDNNTQYYAKSKREDGTQELLQNHLEKVSEMAGVFGEQIGSRKTAELCGKLHDFGKYSESFKGVLERKCTHIDHAICGAAFLYCLLGNRKASFGYRAAMEAINGHHDGLIGYDYLEIFLENSLRNSDPMECNNQKTAALAGQKQYQEATKAFLKDFPQFTFEDFPQFKSEAQAIENVQKLDVIDESIDAMLYTRMLFSCLVDADYTISSEKELQKPLEFKAKQCLKALDKYREELKKNVKGSSVVNDLRDLLFERWVV